MQQNRNQHNKEQPSAQNEKQNACLSEYKEKNSLNSFEVDLTIT